MPITSSCNFETRENYLETANKAEQHKSYFFIQGDLFKYYPLHFNIIYTIANKVIC